MLRNRRVVGVEWGGWRAVHPQTQDEMMGRLLAWQTQGELTPAEPETYPLDDVVQALAAVNGRRVVGKAALVP